MAGAAPSKLRMRAKMASIVRGSVQMKYELLVCAFEGQLPVNCMARGRGGREGAGEEGAYLEETVPGKPGMDGEGE